VLVLSALADALDAAVALQDVINGARRGPCLDVGVVALEDREQLARPPCLVRVAFFQDQRLELTGGPERRALGSSPPVFEAIEASLDKGRGPLATVLVQSGTLAVGDSIVCGTAYGRVRAMLDENSEAMDVALPSRPVQVLGLTSVPRAGDTFSVAPDDRTARQIAEKREAVERAAMLAKRRKRISLEDFTKALEQGKVESMVGDETTLLGLIGTKHNQWRILDQPVDVQQIGIGVRKGEARVRAAVNETLADLEKSGKAAQIFDHWFGKDSDLKMKREFVFAPYKQP
jgi:hypothetical protein